MNNRIITNPNRNYGRVHDWLHYYHKKATKCENPDCTHINAKRFEWALRKGFAYEKKIENFIQLCPSCHRKYDFTDEIRKKICASRKRKPIIQFSLNGEYIKEFESITEAAKVLKINKGNLQTCLKRNHKTSGGFKWQFKRA